LPVFNSPLSTLPGELGPNHPTALRALIAAIKDLDDDVPEEIIVTIGEIELAEGPDLTALLRALENSSPTAREAAQAAIAKLQEDNDEQGTPKKGAAKP
jgi:hypothetical protein